MIKSDGLNNSQLSVDVLSYLLSMAQKVANEIDAEGLCIRLLEEAITLTRADGGTLYLLDKQGELPELDFVLMRNSKLGISENFFQSESPYPGLQLCYPSGDINNSSIAGESYHSAATVNIEDVYEADAFDISSAKKFDKANNYRTKSGVSVPLINRVQQVIGVFQLINAKDVDGNIIPFSKEYEQVLAVFAKFAASALDKQLLVERQRNLLVELSAEPNTEALVERILRESKAAANADGGTLYLLEGDEQSARLTFSLLLNDSLGVYLGGASGDEVAIRPVPLYEDNGEENFHNVVSSAVHKKQTIVLEDVYTTDEYDFSGTKAFDKEFHYRSQSCLVVPLLNHDKDVIGVLQLLNTKDFVTGEVESFTERTVKLVEALSSYASIALNNLLLVQELKALLDSFIECIAKAIDAKSPHTSSHCQRIPILMEMIAQAACDDEGEFRNFSLNEDEWYEIKVAAWMHDCGKLATPDAVLEKSTKLHLMNDGIDTVKARFASLGHQTQAEFYRQMLEHPAKQDALQTQLQERLKEIQSDCDFVVSCNKGGEFMEQNKKDRINSISQEYWLDAQGERQALLSDKEVYNLCIERGTLTPEERQSINNHMSVTIDMLESLPFPRKLQRVPEFAGGHHEKMDGSGFPKGLKGYEMPIPARMMAIADIYEALTSADRPYKDPMKVSVSLNILKNMVNDQHIDPDLFDLFVRSRVWEIYAKQELKPEQLDIEEFEG